MTAAPSAQAEAYTTPSLQALTGSWATGTTSLSMNFGPLRGIGTVTITSLNGGGFVAGSNPASFAGLGYSITDTVLGNGDTLHLDDAIIFSPLTMAIPH